MSLIWINNLTKNWNTPLLHSLLLNVCLCTINATFDQNHSIHFVVQPETFSFADLNATRNIFILNWSRSEYRNRWHMIPTNFYHSVNECRYLIAAVTHYWLHFLIEKYTVINFRRENKMWTVHAIPCCVFQLTSTKRASERVRERDGEGDKTQRTIHFTLLNDSRGERVHSRQLLINLWQMSLFENLGRCLSPPCTKSIHFNRSEYEINTTNDDDKNKPLTSEMYVLFLKVCSLVVVAIIIESLFLLRRHIRIGNDVARYIDLKECIGIQIKFFYTNSTFEC